MNVKNFVNEMNVNNTYKQFVENKYNNYIQYSQIPSSYLVEVNTKSLTKNFSVIYRDIQEIVNDNYSLLFVNVSFMDGNYLSSLLLDKYFVDSLNNNELYLKTVLCVDTVLLLEDYLKHMENSVNPHYNYSPAVLFNYIETADFVIWNRFNNLGSKEYKKNKFLNIVETRKRQGLGNLFLTEQNLSEFKIPENVELCRAIQPDIIVNCEFDKLELL